MGIVACAAAMGGVIVPFEMDSRPRMIPPLSAALDNLVSVKQRSLGIHRARMCSDEVFLRRVFLDVIGTLPTREEAVEFLADKSAGKREALINRLLERPEFADYWGMKWGDILRVKSEFPVNWTPERRADLAVFFSRVGFKKTGEWKEEIVYFNPPPGGDSVPARLPDGTGIMLKPETDPREVFAQWLLSSPNSPFAKNAANRVWFWIFGRGIIQEPDDSRPDNPPSNPELLAWLARQRLARAGLGHGDARSGEFCGSHAALSRRS